MCDPVSAAMGLGTAVLGAQVSAANKAAKLQKEANGIAVQSAKTAADQADQATNRANAKQPDTMALLSANTLSAKGGQSGTMLTGAQGIDPSALLLGKKTLLGG